MAGSDIKTNPTVPPVDANPQQELQVAGLPGITNPFDPLRISNVHDQAEALKKVFTGIKESDSGCYIGESNGVVQFKESIGPSGPGGVTQMRDAMKDFLAEFGVQTTQNALRPGDLTRLVKGSVLTQEEANQFVKLYNQLDNHAKQIEEDHSRIRPSYLETPREVDSKAYHTVVNALEAVPNRYGASNPK